MNETPSVPPPVNPHSPHDLKADHLLLTSSFTVATVIILVFAKTVAYVYSGSAAVLSSLIDSLSDVGLSLMTLLSIRWSLKPADDNHRHGHGKIEGVAALLQSAFLVGAASFLIFEVMSRMLNPQAMHAHLFTMMLMGFSALLSLLLVFVQKRSLAKNRSLALEADHVHYSSDVWINGSTFAVVLLDYLKIFPGIIDLICALAVAGLLLRSAYQIALKAFDMLMDRELSPDIRAKIEQTVLAHPEVQGMHDLRTHQSGLKMFISFDVEVDPNMLMWSAHEIARAVEHDLLRLFPNAEILIHLDPAGDTHDTRHHSKTSVVK